MEEETGTGRRRCKLVEEEDETDMRLLTDIIHLFIAKLLLSYLFPLPHIMSTFPLSFVLFHDVV
jgi:hypothetical protein